MQYPLSTATTRGTTPPRTATHVPSNPMGQCFEVRSPLGFAKRRKTDIATPRLVQRECYDQLFHNATPRHDSHAYIYAFFPNLHMAPRKSHKKTRSGCVQCKRRKVKVNMHRRLSAHPFHRTTLWQWFQPQDSSPIPADDWNSVARRLVHVTIV